MTYSFRLRFRLPPQMRLNLESERWVFAEADAQPRVALTCPQGGLIKDADALVLRGDGYASEEAARADGERFRDALVLALSRNYVGADFGDRAPRGGFTEHGLAWLQGQAGARILNDVHGLMTFETEPVPKFASVSAALQVGVNGPRFETSLRLAYERAQPVPETERVAFDIFGASFFSMRPDARLILLMMAIEVLLKPERRDDATCAHLDALITATEQASTVPAVEREPLVNALRGLKNESQRRAAHRLIAARLGERKYMDMSARRFFGECYTLRSNIVHGVTPTPSNDVIGAHAAALEWMVGDLLAGHLLTSIVF